MAGRRVKKKTSGRNRKTRSSSSVSACDRRMSPPIPSPTTNATAVSGTNAHHR